MILPLPLLLLFGMLAESETPSFGPGKWSILVASLLVGLAVYTLILDIRCFSDWENPRTSVYVRPADHAAAMWIVANTPSDAVIQSWMAYSPESEEGEAYSYSLIPEFGLRKTALGLWLIASFSHGKNDTPAGRLKDIRDVLFRGDDPLKAWEVAKRYDIDYIYIGPYERKKAPDGYRKFESSQGKFEMVYAKDGILIYRIL
jgi:uncharacterized membrane protein